MILTPDFLHVWIPLASTSQRLVANGKTLLTALFLGSVTETFWHQVFLFIHITACKSDRWAAYIHIGKDSHPGISQRPEYHRFNNSAWGSYTIIFQRWVLLIRWDTIYVACLIGHSETYDLFPSSVSASCQYDLLRYISHTPYGRYQKNYIGCFCSRRGHELLVECPGRILCLMIAPASFPAMLNQIILPDTIFVFKTLFAILQDKPGI